MLPVLIAIAAWSASLSSSQAPGIKAVVRTRCDAAPVGLSLLMTRARGSAQSVTVTLAARGNRFVIVHPDAGPNGEGRGVIVDFDERNTYTFMNDTREYRLQTFAQVRNSIGRSYRSGVAVIPSLSEFAPSTEVALPAQSRGRAKRFEYAVDTQETGRRYQMAGYDAREVALTITAVERGKTLEQDGGWVVTSSVWVVPHIPAVDELVALQRRYVQVLTKGIYDTAFTALEFPGNEFYDPFSPEHGVVGLRVVAEIDKLDGTVLSSNTVYELERTAKEMKSFARAPDGAPPKRVPMVAMQLEYVSISTNVSDADLALPAGYKKTK